MNDNTCIQSELICHTYALNFSYKDMWGKYKPKLYVLSKYRISIDV